ncbi:CTLH/CRA C-terminal to lish motif domain-containing protein [Pseudomassariella vexata]|uniref:CTLH/CRA C-terminal to lish motif domain-domain-containing protein n=1 Tax=Pseudomassariella vexata TaxID=1141098 RepID=A0A1Y2DLY5_9PEZI|nr:CTLH/CRA C-terminal to lish motif domain-containing protein [Pseudomassariella vexata]ORY59715.1 CTLH/CRA C-terminal to lish motif domain-domain-containing protein [Pseudomassariella vexata]
MSSSTVREFEAQLRRARDLSEALLHPKMTSSTSTATPMKHAFMRQVDEVKSPKSDINALILDYLTMAGYPNAAARFSAEANLQPQQDDASIVARQQIQNSIHKGDIQVAINALNDMDPEILDTDAPLHFALLRLQLVELIRQCTSSPGGDITPALDFATEQLGPRAPTNSQFLEDLEKTMTLLVFRDTVDPPVAELLKPDLRRDVADKVNKAILQRQQQRRDAAIRHLVQMRAWGEEAVRKETKKDLPARIELGLNGDESDKDGLQENGHEPMIVT